MCFVDSPVFICLWIFGSRLQEFNVPAQRICHYKIGGKKGKHHWWSQWGCYTMWSIPLMLLLKVPEDVYDGDVLQTACQSFWSCYFSWGWVLPFPCLWIAAMSSDLKFHCVIRGAAPSWAKLQVGRNSKYLGEIYSTRFFQSFVCFEGLGLFFLFSFLLICCGIWKLL